MADPLKLPSPTEAYRVMVLLQDAMDKLKFIKVLSEKSSKQEEALKFVGDDISKEIQDQKYWEARYSELARRHSELRGLTNREEMKEVEKEMEIASEKLRDVNKNICKILKDRPNVKNNLLKIETERCRVHDLLEKTYNSLAKDQTFGILQTYVMDMKAHAARLDNARAELRSVKIELGTKLEMEAARKTDAEIEMREGEKRIAEKRDELAKTRLSTKVRMELQSKVYSASQENLVRVLNQEELRMEKRLLALQEENLNLRTAHAEHRRVCTLQTETIRAARDDVDRKLEQAEATTKARINSLRADREKLFAELARDRTLLTAGHSEMEQARRKEEMRRITSQNRADAKAAELLALLEIQKAGRVYLVRKSRRPKKKKKKAKKKPARTF